MIAMRGETEVKLFKLDLEVAVQDFFDKKDMTDYVLTGLVLHTSQSKYAVTATVCNKETLEEAFAHQAKKDAPVQHIPRLIREKLEQTTPND